MPYISGCYQKFRQVFARYFPGVYGIFERRKKIIKFFIAGGISGGVDLVALHVFHSWLEWGIVLSTSAAFVVAFLVSFTLQKFWTFRDNSQDRIAGQLGMYLINGLIGLYLNGFLMHLLVSGYGVWYIAAQIVVNLIIAIQNFIVYKFIVFKKRHEIVSQKKKIG